jgi:hypothetical protein
MLKSSSLCLQSKIWAHSGLKIEISLNDQNCSILSQNVPKFYSVSIMMSFLAYVTGFFMNFELLPILTDYAN